jgi:hypothetical protein
VVAHCFFDFKKGKEKCKDGNILQDYNATLDTANDSIDMEFSLEIFLNKSKQVLN